MPPNQHRVLLVEDNPGDTLLTCERLSAEPDSALQIDDVATLADALALLGSVAFDAVLLDLDLPDSRGLETLCRVRQACAEAPIIVLSGHAEATLRPLALAAGAEDVFTKDEAHSRLFRRSVLFGIERNRARAEHRRIEALLDAMPDAVLVVNSSGLVRYVNQAAIDLFAMSREELEAECLSFSITADEPVEITINRPGDDRTCEMRVVQTAWDGESTQLASIRDITLRKQAEQLRTHSAELKLQNQRITEASRLKSEFLATISHEIRTPMNAIVGLSYLLGHTQLDAEQADLLGKVQVASRSLMSLMNDVLDLSKIEAGEVLLEHLPFDMPELLRELGQLIAPLARGKPIEIVIHAPQDVPRVLSGDVTRLRQILINLLGNSIKFTERGQVHLETSCTRRDEGRADLRFTVRDTGIGMTAEALERIFRPYTQCDASITRRFGGTGLGLSIVRQLVDLMGGDVRVTSQAGIGSEFHVTIPVMAADEFADDSEGAAPSLKLLVAQAQTPSDADRRHSVRNIALRLGWRVEVLPSVAELLARLQDRIWRGQPPDVLVIEPHQQDSHALRGLARMQRRRAANSLPPIVLVAATAEPLPTAGVADATMGGPVTAAQLFNVVNDVLLARGADRDRVASLTRLEATDARCLVGVHVMVVDDSDINREVATRILEREGARTTACAGGAAALDALRHGPAVDAVLMDLQMPGMDGVAATRAIRCEAAWRALPILALTASALEAERQRAVEAGMDDFVCKPLNPPALIRVLRRHVERARGTSILLHPITAEIKPPAACHWPRIQGIEDAEVAERLGGDVERFTTLLGHLLSEFADLADTQMPACSNDAARQALAGRLHKLRGSAGILGARVVQRLAANAESALQSGLADGLMPTMLGMLASALRDLHCHAQPLLERQAAAQADMPDSAAVPPPSPASVEQLTELLRAQDLEAQRRFRDIAPSLRVTMAPACYAELRQAIEGLDFPRALALLDGAVPA